MYYYLHVLRTTQLVCTYETLWQQEIVDSLQYRVFQLLKIHNITKRISVSRRWAGSLSVPDHDSHFWYESVNGTYHRVLPKGVQFQLSPESVLRHKTCFWDRTLFPLSLKIFFFGTTQNGILTLWIKSYKFTKFGPDVTIKRGQKRPRRNSKNTRYKKNQYLELTGQLDAFHLDSFVCPVPALGPGRISTSVQLKKWLPHCPNFHSGEQWWILYSQ